MPSYNSNKYTIVSNNQVYQDLYKSNEGSGINLHSPVSMEGSIYFVPDSDYYYPTDNDYFIYCLGTAYIDLTLNPYKHGKIFVIKAPKNGVVDITVTNTIDDITSPYTIGDGVTCAFHSIMLIYDKVNDVWLIMADYKSC
jgi:hypothetical protein